MDALIASTQDTAPVPKPPPVYPHNPSQVESNKIIKYSSAIGANRYIYATAEPSLNGFDHTTVKVLDITTSLTERSEKSGWGSGTRSITEVNVGPMTYNLFCEYGQFTVEELTAYIKVYVDSDNKRAEYNSEMLATCILASVSAGTRAELHIIYDGFKIDGMVYGELVFKGLTNKAISTTSRPPGTYRISMKIYHRT